MIAYLSGPMSGIPQENRTAFLEAEKLMSIKGHTVLNPHCLPSGLTYEQYMDIDMAMVRACDMLVTLVGWEKSPGATAEVFYARALNKEIHSIKEFYHEQ